MNDLKSKPKNTSSIESMRPKTSDAKIKTRNIMLTSFSKAEENIDVDVVLENTVHIVNGEEIKHTKTVRNPDLSNVHRSGTQLGEFIS